MIITIHYPKDNDASIRYKTDNSIINLHRTYKESTDKTITETFELKEPTNTFLICFKHNTPRNYHYSLFKKNWFDSYHSVFVSYDYYISERIFALEVKPHSEAKIELFFEYDHIKNCLNGNIKLLNIVNIKKENVKINKSQACLLDKKTKNGLKNSLLLAMFFNVLCYCLIPTFYLIMLLFFPQFIWGFSFIDFIAVSLFYLIMIYNTVRYYIGYKDIISKI